jgi:putative redox protein
MPTTMKGTATQIGPMRFRAMGGTSGKELVMDAAPEVGGSGDGFRPMELLLLGLAGCTGIDVVSILRKMRQEITGYEINAEGERQDEHPRRFTRIAVEHVIYGRKVKPESVDRAVRLSAEKYCSASASLAAGATIENTFRIVEEQQDIPGISGRFLEDWVLPCLRRLLASRCRRCGRAWRRLLDW